MAIIIIATTIIRIICSVGIPAVGVGVGVGVGDGLGDGVGDGLGLGLGDGDGLGDGLGDGGVQPTGVSSVTAKGFIG